MILMTGDYPAHDIWYQSEELNLNAASTVINLIKEFFPGVTVLPCMGNHEAFPANL